MFSVDTEFLFMITDTSSQDSDLSQAFSLARQGLSSLELETNFREDLFMLE